MIQACPHCKAGLFALSRDGAKLKAITSILVLHKSGEVEINCTSCKNGVLLPLAVVPGAQLAKGRVAQRLTVRRGLTSSR